mmetsp:Transcript_15596/g.25837  ORF Transcript_15596/g.25837 Transcript_15596/m.25837 type:complete len:231 (-) Transcript_15596:992-1684(-)
MSFCQVSCSNGTVCFNGTCSSNKNIFDSSSGNEIRLLYLRMAGGVTIVFIIIFSCICFWAVYHKHTRRRTSNVHVVVDMRNVTRHRQPDAPILFAFLRVPSIEYSSSKEGVGTTCAICLSDFLQQDSVRTLPCSPLHTFHSTCIDPWFKMHCECPLCKQDVLAISPALWTPPSIDTSTDTPPPDDIMTPRANEMLSIRVNAPGCTEESVQSSGLWVRMSNRAHRSRSYLS